MGICTVGMEEGEFLDRRSIKEVKKPVKGISGDNAFQTESKYKVLEVGRTGMFKN